MPSGEVNYQFDDATKASLNAYLDPTLRKKMWIRVSYHGKDRTITLLSSKDSKLKTVGFCIKDFFLHPMQYLGGFFGSRKKEAEKWLMGKVSVFSSLHGSEKTMTVVKAAGIEGAPAAPGRLAGLSPGQKNILVDELGKRGVAQEQALQIAEGALKNWEGFFEEITVGGKKLCKQTYHIDGLKVYRDPKTGELVADIALKQVGEGGYKKAKAVARIFSAKEIVEIVRYAKGEDVNVGEEGSRIKFAEDIAKELSVRKEITANKGPVPHLLDIYEAQYVNKMGEVKTRYLTERCDGDLSGFLDKEEEAYSQGKAQIFHYCSHALEALLELHGRGFVHNDIKPGNILYNQKKDEGVLADLGLVTKKGEESTVPGSRMWFSPEKQFNHYSVEDPSSDIFSFGLILLAIYDKKLFGDMHDVQEYGGQWGEDSCKASVEKAQADLREKGDKMGSLIADMLDWDPKKRPAGPELLQRYRGCC